MQNRASEQNPKRTLIHVHPGNQLLDPRNRTKWPSISVHTGLDPLPPVPSSALDDHTFDMKVSDTSRETAEGRKNAYDFLFPYILRSYPRSSKIEEKQKYLGAPSRGQFFLDQQGGKNTRRRDRS
ncbi:hypothetical protein CEXT_342181 [Caerostris extrusa]|uniref:Uncharacterized protein n=1 Tax=Caerostris extrusa TaxID=172846 RepID=A0AAV4UZT8_CAEEX|nr:hypothetical protein CEXT_342181 [Caerostris extrusa]